MADEQELFLIEFLVDKVKIPVIRAMQEELLPASTCVSFQILSLPPIDICQEALTDGCGCIEGDTQVFKKGKSCLFALPSIVLQRPLTTFPIKLSVYKKLPPGVLPDVMLIGSYQIEAKAIINAVLSQQVFKIPNPCQTIKDTFKITTTTGQCVGSVTVYIRASCFGKKIITQFQIPHNRKPYLFKGADDSPVFQCKKIPSECYTPAPVKCTCTKKCDGSGETAGRTCCATPIVQTNSCPPLPKQPDYGPRPCCATRQGKQCPCSPKARRKEQQTCPCSTDQTFAAIREAARQEGKCTPCAEPPPCPPCCGAATPKKFSDLITKETVKKCGCPVKDYSCNCCKSK
ncbi:hypothetical protein HZU73_07090 [Apis mellifera caucasica]|uniref:Uncharacterized protein LOC113219320 n=1 Tax=Apis mellifera TaxID=7460 RepID=A0A7M7MVX3_APIME|nr:uncharacterized protein LOC113219320 [Apis mellifera]KAG6797770.1 hypothetical protein HZU73_07090 [Apis mellifera caucasica]KAG9437622.1 hypothetical protein HZU67_00631 [Apis mellifera carnica]|eukprot:XP_026301654.1 uncharacterized protein LOC113219320 [Apis mellifera]